MHYSNRINAIFRLALTALVATLVVTGNAAAQGLVGRAIVIDEDLAIACTTMENFYRATTSGRNERLDIFAALIADGHCVIMRVGTRGVISKLEEGDDGLIEVAQISFFSDSAAAQGWMSVNQFQMVD